MQYFVNVVTGADGEPVYYSHGIDKENKYKDCCTGLQDHEYICTTTYKYRKQYQEHINDLFVSKAKMIRA